MAHKPDFSNPSSDRNVFSQRLSALMKETITARGKSETQKDLGIVLGKSATAVGYYVTGKNFPDTEILKKIAVHYNVSIDWLLGMPNATKRIDPDIQAACKLTGLSEEVISAFANSVDSTPSMGLNRLFEIEGFPIEFTETMTMLCLYLDELKKEKYNPALFDSQSLETGMELELMDFRISKLFDNLKRLVVKDIESRETLITKMAWANWANEIDKEREANENGEREEAHQ